MSHSKSPVPVTPVCQNHFPLPVPPVYQQLLGIYDAVDKVYSFLNKNKSSCPVSTIGAVCQTLGVVLPFESSSDVINENDSNSHAPGNLVKALGHLAALCPEVIILDRDVSQSSSLAASSNYMYCPSCNGTTPAQAQRRRAKVIDCFTKHLVGCYLAASSTASTASVNVNAKTKKSAIEAIVRAGSWPADVPAPLPSIPVASTDAHTPENLVATRTRDAFHETRVSGIESVPSKDIPDSIVGLIERLRASAVGNANQIEHIEVIPRRNAVYAELPSPALPPPLLAALAATLNSTASSTCQWYAHQVRGMTALRDGHHLSLSTSTSSGKSMVYNVPIIEYLLRSATTDDDCEGGRPTASTALYLFPTKALAQDQLRSVSNLCEAVNRQNNSFTRDIVVAVCDGDTGHADRDIARQHAHIVLSNPDMLHVTLLPAAQNSEAGSGWKRFFANLRFVVVDEAHHYRGSFGAHMAALFRRLLRVCLHHSGRIPQFVCCSATIANPGEHMLRLIPLHAFQQQIVVVDHTADGSPCGERHFLVWNPPLKFPGSIPTSSAPAPEFEAVNSSLNVASLSATQSQSDSCKPPTVDGSKSICKVKHIDNTNVSTSSTAFIETMGDTGRPKAFGALDEPSVAYSGGWKRRSGSQKEYAASNNTTKAARVAPAIANLVSSKDMDDGRRSSIVEMANLFAYLVTMHKRTIAFCGVRKLTELVLRYALRTLRESDAPDLALRVASYRGGYVAKERRSIEREMFSGNLLGITATCALELGVDIGSLDCTLHLGFPGSFSSLWQQAGRAGRSGRDSLSILVCFDSPLEQFLCRNPSVLFGSPPEAAVVDTSNIHVLRTHLHLASYEVPLNSTFCVTDSGVRVSDEDLWGTNGCYEEVLDGLRASKLIRPVDSYMDDLNDDSSRQLWTHMYSRDASNIPSLRTVGPAEIKIIDETLDGGTHIDSIGYSRAFFEIFEGAIYLHRAKQYVITKIELSRGHALCKPTNVDYFTSSRNRTTVHSINVLEADELFRNGNVQVVARVYGYKKMKLYTNVVFEQGEFTLPPMEYKSRALWVDVPLALQGLLRDNTFDVYASIHAVNHALLVVAPLVAQCDTHDIASEHVLGVGINDELCRILIYDTVPGGLGISDKLYDMRLELFSKALSLLQSCSCANHIGGCTSCILDSRCTYYNKNLHRQGAILLLQGILERCSDRKGSASAECHPTTQQQASIASQAEDHLTPRKKARLASIKESKFPEFGSRVDFEVQREWTGMRPSFTSSSQWGSP